MTDKNHLTSHRFLLIGILLFAGFFVHESLSQTFGLSVVEDIATDTADVGVEIPKSEMFALTDGVDSEDLNPQSEDQIRARIAEIDEEFRFLNEDRKQQRVESAQWRKAYVSLLRDPQDDEQLAELLDRQRMLEVQAREVRKEIEDHIKAKPDMVALSEDREQAQQRFHEITQALRELMDEKQGLLRQLAQIEALSGQEE